nr:hypothetical protein BaRGS_003630 [Batillaria attramentaria]
MFENDAEKHAEEHLLDHLRLLLSVIDKDKLVSLTILQNSSPCARCAELYTNDELLTELAGHPDVNVELVFSSIHRVRRPSCRWKHHGHVDDIDVDEHKDNLDGLKTLSLAGFQLRATNDGDWAELRSALQLPNTSYQGDYDQGTSSRHEEDCTLEEDLEYLRENIF